VYGLVTFANLHFASGDSEDLAYHLFLIIHLFIQAHQRPGLTGEVKKKA
jgi:hypothetical protein